MLPEMGEMVIAQENHNSCHHTEDSDTSVGIFCLLIIKKKSKKSLLIVPQIRLIKEGDYYFGLKY